MILIADLRFCARATLGQTCIISIVFFFTRDMYIERLRTIESQEAFESSKNDVWFR